MSNVSTISGIAEGGDRETQNGRHFSELAFDPRVSQASRLTGIGELVVAKCKKGERKTRRSGGGVKRGNKRGKETEERRGEARKEDFRPRAPIIRGIPLPI